LLNVHQTFSRLDVRGIGPHRGAPCWLPIDGDIRTVDIDFDDELAQFDFGLQEGLLRGVALGGRSEGGIAEERSEMTRGLEVVPRLELGLSEVVNDGRVRLQRIGLLEGYACGFVVAGVSRSDAFGE